MKRHMLKSKIHRATVTGADLNYEGSISIDPALCAQADLVEFEQVDVYDIDNGSRLTTYVIFGKPGEVCLNGAAARLVHRGDRVIVASYVDVEEGEVDAHKPRILLLDADNRVAKERRPPVRRQASRTPKEIAKQ